MKLELFLLVLIIKVEMLSRNNTFFYPYTTSSSGFLDFCEKLRM